MKILVYCNKKKETCPLADIKDHYIQYGDISELNNKKTDIITGYDVVILHLDDLNMVNEFTAIIKSLDIATHIIVVFKSYIEGNEYIKNHDIYSYVVDDASALGNLRLHFKNIEEECSYSE